MAEIWEDYVRVLDDIVGREYVGENDNCPHDIDNNNNNNNGRDHITEIFTDLTKISWDTLNITIEENGEWEKNIYNNPDINNKNQETIYNADPGSIKDDWSNIIIDKCAWYKSYHYQPDDHWGIHIKEDCWIEYAKKIYRYNNLSQSKTDALKSAFLFLYCHELFHYITDNATTVLELTTRRGMYINYFNSVYTADFAGDGLNAGVGSIEEAMANSFLYRRWKYCKINKELLKTILESMTFGGYNQFVNYLGRNFRKGKRMLINQIYHCQPRPIPNNLHLLPIESVFEMLDPKKRAGNRVPIWLHTNTRNRKLQL
jgi:hypothetical protein